MTKAQQTNLFNPTLITYETNIVTTVTEFHTVYYSMHGANHSFVVLQTNYVVPNAPNVGGVAAALSAGPRTPKQPSVMPPSLPAPMPRKAMDTPRPGPGLLQTNNIAPPPPDTAADDPMPKDRLTFIYGYPEQIPFTVKCRNNMGEFYDPITGGVTSNRWEMIWAMPAGHYSSWWYCSNDVKQATNWHKFPDSASCPANTETNIVYLPVMKDGQRFYSLRGS